MFQHLRQSRYRVPARYRDFFLSFPARRLPPLRWGMNGGA
nr:MAG TPA: hypothetical protein [Caudoviricetes sp.]